MKTKYFLVFLFILLLVVAFSACSEAQCKHIEVTDPQIVPTCTEDGLSEGKHCSLCLEILVPQKVLPKLGHDEVTDIGRHPTCSSEGYTGRKYCALCGETLRPSVPVDKLEHTVDLSNDIAPTCTRWGFSEHAECSVCHETVQEREFIKPTGHSYVYGKCSVCNFKINDYSDVYLYVGDEGYRFFDTYKNGEAMRDFYDEMEDVLVEFHSNPNKNATYYYHEEDLGDLYTVAKFNYKKYGLTFKEAETAFSLLRKDFPIFYWISYYIHWDDSSIRVTTVKEYAKGEDRAKFNELVYDGIEGYIMLAAEETEAYNIALVFYDEILKNNSYAENARGAAEDALWAHSIIGAFTHGKFVCEGYARLFQLLLNVCRIENMYVVGDTDGEHCWNLARMDDGNWYWFDPTWGDSNKDSYKYFCVTDNAVKDHIPQTPEKLGFYFNADIPKRANSAFKDDSILEIGESFFVDGIKYSLAGAGKVKCIGKSNLKENMVAYNGRVYEIVK